MSDEKANVHFVPFSPRDPEVDALHTIANAMATVDAEAQDRIASWVWDRYGRTVDDELRELS